MISVVYCTRSSNKDHKEHLIKSSGLHNKIEVIEIINNGESLTTSYNRGLKESKNNIVVFCHDDITIETKQWGNKLLKLLDKNDEYGIVGVAGTKFMSETGRWWDNPKKMYGKVLHTHEGKTWLSSYSDDLGQSIEDTVVVDGLFFAINKEKIVKPFNEDFEGYHFYDVSFCFDNFLSGVKIGVTTLIRVNHKSIGMTNQQWEDNRVKFSETYKKHLPVNIIKKLRKDEKLKLMIASTNFEENSPKSKIILEFAKKLKSKNHDVTICSNYSTKMSLLAKQLGVNMTPISQPPGFIIGDGKATINTNEGKVPTKPNTLYKIKDYKFDVIHSFDDEIINHFHNLYNGTSIVNTSFTNSLFINPQTNPLVKTTINLTGDIEDFQKLEIDGVINEYLNVI